MILAMEVHLNCYKYVGLPDSLIYNGLMNEQLLI